jgi:hypothetical protein
MLMSCLISLLLELACLIAIYSMSHNVSKVIHNLACLVSHCLIFDRNIKFGPEAVLLFGICEFFSPMTFMIQ